MTTTVAHPCPRFDGPYFSASPLMLGEGLWRSEAMAHGSHHPAAILAGGWFAIGLGALQTRHSLRMLRDAEHWLRTLGDGYDRDLGVNLAAQGLGLVQLEHHGPAARRLREALTLLDDLGYEHPADLMLMSTRLAAVELQLFGPVAGLKRLHAGQHYQRFCSIEVLFEAASVRGQLLQALDSQECERDYYMNPGQYQRCANAISDSVDACCEAIDSLMLGGDKKSAVGLASNCLSELLSNRNLSSVDLQDATDRLRSSFYETNG